MKKVVERNGKCFAFYVFLGFQKHRRRGALRFEFHFAPAHQARTREHQVRLSNAEGATKSYETPTEI